MDRGATDALIEIARAVRYETIPSPALRVARQALLDWAGVALAGSREPLAHILRRQLAGPDGAHGLIGAETRASLLDAALINGAASHALDYDDTHTAMMGHPTVPVAPVLLALAERRACGGRDVLAAYVAGVETECRLGELLDFTHYEVGFHSTGTLGTFGAAAAAAHLLGLDEDAWRHAFGLAGTQAAGLKSGFGSMAKPLHAGRAAANGLLAATLAADGFSAQEAVVEEPQGFAATHHGGNADAARLANDPDRFRTRDMLFKYHAACYLTHASIEATLQLHRELACEVEAVSQVDIVVPPAVLDVCNLQEPATGLEAKFSLRATAAMALLGIDTSGLASYRDELVRDPEFCAVRDRVRVRRGEGTRTTVSTVTLRLADGRSESCTYDAGVPADDLDRQGDKLRAKFDALAGEAVGEQRASAIATAIAELDAAESLDALVGLLVA